MILEGFQEFLMEAFGKICSMSDDFFGVQNSKQNTLLYRETSCKKLMSICASPSRHRVAPARCWDPASPQPGQKPNTLRGSGEQRSKRPYAGQSVINPL